MLAGTFLTISNAPFDISKSDEEILRRADYNLSRGRWLRSPEKNLYPGPAYQLRDTSHRDLVRGEETGAARRDASRLGSACGRCSRNDLTAVSCIIRASPIPSLTSPRFISRRIVDLQSNMIFSVY